jgi:carbon storage regulator CsrA
MLVLSRRIGEAIVIGEDVRIVVADVRGERVRLGISAPSWVRVDRQEVHERRTTAPCPGSADVQPSRTGCSLEATNIEEIL